MIVYLLTFEYSDKSAFHVCGVTDSWNTADAWMKASGGEHKVYDLKVNALNSWDDGRQPWNTFVPKPLGAKADEKQGETNVNAGDSQAGT